MSECADCGKNTDSGYGTVDGKNYCAECMTARVKETLKTYKSESSHWWIVPVVILALMAICIILLVKLIE
mgnify:CR=1 FL=1